MQAKVTKGHCKMTLFCEKSLIKSTTDFIAKRNYCVFLEVNQRVITVKMINNKKLGASDLASQKGKTIQCLKCFNCVTKQKRMCKKGCVVLEIML